MTHLVSQTKFRTDATKSQQDVAWRIIKTEADCVKERKFKHSKISRATKQSQPYKVNDPA